MSIVNYHGLDENAISVPCKIDGCNARVHGDVSCVAHGGDPIYQWSETDWGTRTYYTKPQPEGRHVPTQRQEG